MAARGRQQIPDPPCRGIKRLGVGKGRDGHPGDQRVAAHRHKRTPGGHLCRNCGFRPPGEPASRREMRPDRFDRLILGGTGPTEQLWQSIAAANLAAIPGCTHAVHLEKPILFNTVLEDFLSG